MVRRHGSLSVSLLIRYFCDEQGGVGSFLRQNRTLYIGRIKTTRDIDNIVERHFEEFGEIEKSQFDRFVFQSCTDQMCLESTVKILQARGVAFVTYVHEHQAQFAKEAMMCQSLDADEVCNVRSVHLIIHK